MKIPIFHGIVAFKKYISTTNLTIVCYNIKEAKQLHFILNEMGFKWANGDSYLKYFRFEYRPTCYYVKKRGSYSSYSFAMDNNIPMVNFEDFNAAYIKSITDNCWK